MLSTEEASRLIREIVAQAGGTIELHESDRAIDLRVSLPKHAVRERELLVVAPTQEGSGKRVLSVEDTDRGGDLIRYYLRNYYDVEIARNAEEAVHKAMTSTFDVILLDIDLGSGMNGIELARLLRGMETYKRTPIIAVTGQVTRETAQQCIDAGCNAYLAKPFLKNDLFRVIHSVEDQLR